MSKSILLIFFILLMIFKLNAREIGIKVLRVYECAAGAKFKGRLVDYKKNEKYYSKLQLVQADQNNQLVLLSNNFKIDLGKLRDILQKTIIYKSTLRKQTLILKRNNSLILHKKLREYDMRLIDHRNRNQILDDKLFCTIKWTGGKSKTD